MNFISSKNSCHVFSKIETLRCINDISKSTDELPRNHAVYISIERQPRITVKE